MDPIRVNKKELLDRLKTNRAEHQDIFAEAQVKYRERVIDELDRRLKDAKAGRKIDVLIYLPVPEDHTQDYDRVIDMLEMSLDDEIMLNERDAAQYVLNQWSWAGTFAANTTSYVTS